uniref:Apoptotic chromatin condensation inducer in the nucleus n=1 Tax=Talaromyces marneffei PM1 TaxID=1077442 RepID=A0A093V704_TALMA
MSDYSKLKVTELKAELKNRGVPQTGLRLKQDFINKLIELDSESGERPAAPDASQEPSAEKEENKDEQNNEGDQKTDEPASASHQSRTESLPTEGAPSSQKPGMQLDGASGDIQPATVESKDAETEATQAETEQQTTIDRPATRIEEAVPDTVADSQKIVSGEPTAPAQPEEEAATEQPTPAEVSTKNQGIDSEPPTDGGDDLRKRKRRSQSPPPIVEVVKKSKIDNENPRVILKEDVHTRETGSEDVQPEVTTEPISTGREDPRFRDILPARKPSVSVQSPEETMQDNDRQVEPALHPATCSIYIRNLMRPLQPLILKNHLQSLATPAGKELGGKLLVDFFLDSIKTHCFALFDSISTASRVRSKLHGAVWPNERDRKPLWADFIPDERFNEWVKMEQESAANRGTQRWEVFYETTDDGVEAILQEVRNGARSGHQPTAPARHHSPDAELRRGSQPSTAPPQQQQSSGKGFKALDDRFKSTKTKPKLYYLPVSRDIVDKRLAQFDTLIRKDSRHHGQGDEDMRRITFEDTDVFVDGGPEYRGPRGGGGGGRRGGRGSWRGRRR